MKNSKLILFVLIAVALTACHKMTKREAVNFNDNVIFCIEDIESYQARAQILQLDDGKTIEDMEASYDKVIDKSKGYKDELKDVFKSYRHPACKKLKKAFYVYVDEQVELTKEHKTKIIDLYKAYMNEANKGDSIASVKSYDAFKQALTDYETSSKPIVDKVFLAHDSYVAETGIRLRH